MHPKKKFNDNIRRYKVSYKNIKFVHFRDERTILPVPDMMKTKTLFYYHFPYLPIHGENEKNIKLT